MNLRLGFFVVALLAPVLLTTACAPGSPAAGQDVASQTSTPTQSSSPTPSPSPTLPVGELVITSDTEAAVVSDPVTFTLDNGTIASATVTGAEGEVEGALEGNRWTPTSMLAFDTDYTLSVTTTQGEQRQASFHTVAPGQRAGFEPLYQWDGAGVGMPIYVKFYKEVPEAYRAAIEQRSLVTTEPAQEGSWGWISSTEMLWRPREYWQPGTKINLDMRVAGVQISDDYWLMENETSSFTISDVSRVVKVDMANFQTSLVENGEVVNTMPSTAGKPGFITRSGTKIILEKHDAIRMSSETINIPSGSGDDYDLDVKWALRVTWTGEFIHAAPWSVGSQGNSNVSHGCIGLSTDNAYWLYQRVSVGDPVEFTGTDRPMYAEEGLGVWLFSWEQWQQQSALA